MRPKAIVTFERLFLLSIVLSAGQLAMDANERIGTIGPVTLMVIKALGILLSVALVLLVSRWRSNAARWVLAVLTAAGVAALLAYLGSGEGIDSSSIVGILGTGLQAAAVAMLFTAGARDWFAPRAASGAGAE